MGEWTDVELFLAMGQRDEKALVELYGRYGIAVYQAASQLCGSQAAEEVTHTVFLSLWNLQDVYDPNRVSMRSYLLGAAHRRAVELMRDEVDALDSATAEVQHYDRGSRALALSANHGIRALLTDLSDRQRHALLLAYFGGYTYLQIASRLQLSEACVKESLNEGLRTVRLTAFPSSP